MATPEQQKLGRRIKKNLSRTGRAGARLATRATSKVASTAEDVVDRSPEARRGRALERDQRAGRRNTLGQKTTTTSPTRGRGRQKGISLKENRATQARINQAASDIRASTPAAQAELESRQTRGRVTGRTPENIGNAVNSSISEDLDTARNKKSKSPLKRIFSNESKTGATKENLSNEARRNAQKRRQVKAARSPANASDIKPNPKPTGVGRAAGEFVDEAKTTFKQGANRAAEAAEEVIDKATDRVANRNAQNFGVDNESSRRASRAVGGADDVAPDKPTGGRLGRAFDKVKDKVKSVKPSFGGSKASADAAKAASKAAGKVGTAAGAVGRLSGPAFAAYNLYEHAANPEESSRLGRDFLNKGREALGFQPEAPEEFKEDFRLGNTAIDVSQVGDALVDAGAGFVGRAFDGLTSLGRGIGETAARLVTPTGSQPDLYDPNAPADEATIQRARAGLAEAAKRNSTAEVETAAGIPPGIPRLGTGAFQSESAPRPTPVGSQTTPEGATRPTREDLVRGNFETNIPVGDNPFSALLNLGRLNAQQRGLLNLRDQESAAAQQEFDNNLKIYEAETARAKTSAELQKLDAEMTQKATEMLINPETRPAAEFSLLQGFVANGSDPGGLASGLLLQKLTSKASPLSKALSLELIDSIRAFFNPKPGDVSDLQVMDGKIYLDARPIAEIDDFDESTQVIFQQMQRSQSPAPARLGSR